MANPTLPTLTNEEATDLQNTISPLTGMRYIRHGVDVDDDPSVGTKLTESEYLRNLLLAKRIGGAVVQLATPFQIGAFAVRYRIGATSYYFAGNAGKTLTASNTHYVYLDTDQTLKSNTTAFPADCIRLAVVTTDGSGVSAIQDRWAENADQGGTNNWWEIAAGGDVDLDDHWLTGVAGIQFGADEIQTISGGVVTVTASQVRVDTEDAEDSDDLDTITADGEGMGRLLLLRARVDDRTVVVKDGTGNIVLADGDFTMDSADKMILLWQSYNLLVPPTYLWYEISRSAHEITTLLQSLDCDYQRIKNVGALEFGAIRSATISGGIADAAFRTYLKLTPESGLEDDLDRIDNFGAGGLVIVRPALATHVITVKHSTGYIRLNTGEDRVLAGVDAHLILIESGGGEGPLQELVRAPLSIADLVDTARCIPYPIQASIPGALVAGAQEEWHYYCPYEIVIQNVTAYCDTEPTGGNCIVDLLDDGMSIFASEGEMCVIADGQHSDVSDTKNAVVAAGSILSLEIKSTGSSPNGAADLTVGVNAMIAPKTAPETA